MYLGFLTRYFKGRPMFWNIVQPRSTYHGEVERLVKYIHQHIVAIIINEAQWDKFYYSHYCTLLNQCIC